MKNIICLITFFMVVLTTKAQAPVLSYSGDLYMIPGHLTAAGKSYMYSYESPCKFTIYGEDLQILNSIDHGNPFSYKQVEKSYHQDTKYDKDWVDEGRGTTKHLTVYPRAYGFNVYSDETGGMPQFCYLTQTLFDDDEGVEFLCEHLEQIPLTELTKVDKPNDELCIYWSEEDFMYYYSRYKTETYGGYRTNGFDIVTLFGVVKATIPDVMSINKVYKYRGRCYLSGYNAKDNTNVLYLITSTPTQVKEIQRTPVNLIVKREGGDLVINTDGSIDGSIVVSSTSGSIMRNQSVTMQQTDARISLDGLPAGIYVVTLFHQNSPVQSAKIVIE